MRFGLQLPVQAQSTVFAESWERTAGPDEMLAVALAAEAAGFDHLGVCDHTAIPADRVGKMGATWFEPLTTLAWVAQATTTIRLLTHVYILAQRHPLQAAKSLATLDRLSGGRLVIGIGAGHVEPEFDLVGASFEDRGAATNEAIGALRLALRDEVPDHPGPRWPFSGMHVAPRPVQSPPPIWVGGSSPAAIRRAGTLGDGWIPQGTLLGDMPGQLALLHHARAQARRADAPFSVGAMALPMWVGEPDWEPGPWTKSGSVDHLSMIVQRFVDLGVTDLQVRLRSRSAEELIDQLGRFSAVVAAFP